MSHFMKTTCARQFGSAWYQWKDVDGNTRMVPHHELLNGKWVETKEYREMKKWIETG